MATTPDKSLFDAEPHEEQEAAMLMLSMRAAMMKHPQPKIRMLAAAQLLALAFTEHFVPALRVAAWENYCYWRRRKIMEEVTNARHGG